MSYNPETGLVYLPVSESGYIFAPLPAESFKPERIGVNIGVGYAGTLTQDPSPDLGTPPAFRSFLMAWDPVARKEVWRSTEMRSGPGSGVLSTAGGLVFTSDRAGELAAFDASSGEKLWSMEAHTGVVAAAASYEVEGVQYVAVAAGYGNVGYGRSNNSRLLVFKLGGTAELPPAPPPPPPLVLSPPPMTASADVVAAGGEVFQRHCLLCHETPAANRNLFPDLRYSAALHDAAVWKAVVIDGALQSNGMSSFAEQVTPDEAEAVRAYMISRAHQAMTP
jgi:alcohol dehydrogenase (cytochrome c)/quinohemoprotein ethanol dehydrogenase